MSATLYLLVGAPGAGKTTWALQHPELVHISSDAIRKELFGKEMTLRGYHRVHRIMMARALDHLAAGRDVVLDSAHVSLSSRRKVLRALPDDVRAVAVHIATPVPQALVNNQMRDRHVPKLGICISGKRLVEPTEEEGFDCVMRVQKDSRVRARA